MEDTEISWAAGFFEGEGSVYIAPQKSGKNRLGEPASGHLRVTISQSYSDYTLRRWAKALGVEDRPIQLKRGTHVKKDGTVAPIYRIDLAGRRADLAMYTMLGYLSPECPKLARYLAWVDAGGVSMTYRMEDRKS